MAEFDMGLMYRMNINVNVVENSDNTVHITMPKAPRGAAELSNEELAGAAGGACWNKPVEVSIMAG